MRRLATSCDRKAKSAVISCGKSVNGLWSIWAKSVSYTTTHFLASRACVQSYEFVDSLYYKCTQVLHSSFIDFISVNGKFYSLSTQPIKTTTYLKKGY